MLPKGYAKLGSEKMAAAADKLKEFYFSNRPTQEDFVRVRKSNTLRISLNMCFQSLSFSTFTYGVLKTVEAHLKNPKKSTPVFLYLFKASREDSAMKRLLGILHIKGSHSLF